MPVSIIIPSLNSPLIDQVLNHLQQQTAWSEVGEILVVGKDEPGLVEPDHIVRLLDTGIPVGASKARNIGIEEAGHDLIFLLDSDCLPVPTWMAEHLTAQAAGHAIVGGGIIPIGDGYWSLSYNLTFFHEFLTTVSPGPHKYLPTLNLSIQRAVVDAAGLLNERLPRGEDIEWTLRMGKAGYQPYFWPAAAVYHQNNRTTFNQVWMDNARAGFYMRDIRINHGDALKSPGILRYRRLLFWISPLIAAWVTGRIIQKNPATFWSNRNTIPAIYLTKIAWCWGASRQAEPR